MIKEYSEINVIRGCFAPRTLKSVKLLYRASEIIFKLENSMRIVMIFLIHWFLLRLNMEKRLVVTLPLNGKTVVK